MKNKIIIFVGIFACCGAVAETDYIDIQIRELQQRRDELKAELDACEENTRKFKIAGVATLGATGVGVVGNIALHNEIKKIEQSKNGAGYGGGYSGGGGSLGNGKPAEDTCALDPICKWERQCKMQNYKVKNCDHDTDCCAADGCPCEK